MSQAEYIINILEWDLTYTDLMHWVAENDVVMDAINGYGGGASTKYSICDADDYIAFKLKFAKEKSHTRDTGFFYAPYIPNITL